MCRACATRRCRRFRPRTLSHRYPTACTSSGAPSILGLRGARVLRLRVELRGSGPVLGVGAPRRVATCLLGCTQITPDEAENRGQGRGPCPSLTGEPGDYPISQGRGLRSQDLEAHWFGRLESPDVAHPRGALAPPVGVAELLGPQGRGDQDKPPPGPVVGGLGHHGRSDDQLAPGRGEGGPVVPEV